MADLKTSGNGLSSERRPITHSLHWTSNKLYETMVRRRFLFLGDDRYHAALYDSVSDAPISAVPRYLGNRTPTDEGMQSWKSSATVARVRDRSVAPKNKKLLSHGSSGIRRRLRRSHYTERVSPFPIFRFFLSFRHFMIRA